MALFSRISALVALVLVLFTTSPVCVSSTSVATHHKWQCQKWKRIVWDLEKSLHTTEIQCPRERRMWYRMAKRTRGCVFARWNGLVAARKMQRVCWKKWVSAKYRWSCHQLSWTCKQALKYTKRGDEMKCEEKVRKLLWSLKKAMKKLKYYEQFCMPKPSNMPRKPKWG